MDNGSAEAKAGDTAIELAAELIVIHACRTEAAFKWRTADTRTGCTAGQLATLRIGVHATARDAAALRRIANAHARLTTREGAAVRIHVDTGTARQAAFADRIAYTTGVELTALEDAAVRIEHDTTARTRQTAGHRRRTETRLDDAARDDAALRIHILTSAIGQAAAERRVTGAALKDAAHQLTALGINFNTRTIGQTAGTGRAAYRAVAEVGTFALALRNYGAGAGGFIATGTRRRIAQARLLDRTEGLSTGWIASDERELKTAIRSACGGEAGGAGQIRATEALTDITGAQRALIACAIRAQHAVNANPRSSLRRTDAVARRTFGRRERR